MADPSIWGKHLWAEWRHRAIAYTGNAEVEIAWIRIFRQRVRNLCTKCADNFDGLILANPPSLGLGAKGYFISICQIQNEVSRTIPGKRIFSNIEIEQCWRRFVTCPSCEAKRDIPNEDRKGRIVRANASGLFYNLAKVLHTIRLWPGESLEVDWTPRFPTGFKYGSAAGENVWDVLFEPLGKVSNPIAVFDRHPSDADGWISDNIARFYRSSDPTWRYLLNAAWRRIKLQPETKRRMNEAVVMLPPGPRVGVHVRNDHHKGEQPSRKMPTLAQMADAVEARRVGVAKVVLATDNNEAVRFFRQRFGDQLYVALATRARLATDQPIDVTAPGSIDNAYEVLADAGRLASCDHLIHVCSNVSTFAMVVNPELAHTFVEAQ